MASGYDVPLSYRSWPRWRERRVGLMMGWFVGSFAFVLIYPSLARTPLDQAPAIPTLTAWSLYLFVAISIVSVVMHHLWREEEARS